MGVGFDQVMPEGRRTPFNMMPRFNQSLAIKISSPINYPYPRPSSSSSNLSDDDDDSKEVRRNQQRILEFRNRYRGLLSCPATSDGARPNYDSLKEDQEAKQIRMELASLLHSQLLATRS